MSEIEGRGQGERIEVEGSRQTLTLLGLTPRYHQLVTRLPLSISSVDNAME